MSTDPSSHPAASMAAASVIAALSHAHAALLEQTAQFAANALLLSGPAHVGKLALAHAIAAQHNCALPVAERGPSALACGRCPSCLALAAASHPDVLLIQPKATTSSGKAARRRLIPIGAIHAERDRKREYEQHVSPFLELPPSHQRRVVIVQSAESLVPEAANALLKLVEEPPHRALFVFLAEDARAVLPTIASRSMRFAVPPVAPELLAEFAPQPLSEDLLAFAAGRIGVLQDLTTVTQALADAYGLQQALQVSLFATLQTLEQLEKNWHATWHPEALRFVWRQLPYMQRARADTALLELQENLEAYVNPSLCFQILAFELWAALTMPQRL